VKTDRVLDHIPS